MSALQGNAFYAQSGGVTAVINHTAAAVIETARSHPHHITGVLAGKHGILGALEDQVYDTSMLSDIQLQQLKQTPGGAFGSCRYKLSSYEDNPQDYQRLLAFFKANNIRYFFYNGGGDSQDTTHKIACYCQTQDWAIQCIGIPKTIDNDLPFTDHCPGFGSVAKYVAVSIAEASLDVAAMAASSTKVFVMEVMGRHAGWIAAAGGLAAKDASMGPHLILYPEIAYDAEAMQAKVTQSVAQYGYCAIVVSEGLRHPNGEFLADAGTEDAFGHRQLGGVAPQIAHEIKQSLGYKYHWAVSDYLQRSARHIASQTDVDHAYALGKAAVEMAIDGKQAVMPIIVRDSDSPYRWHIESVALEKVANVEKPLPREFISEDGFGITDACRRYLQPLIAGEAYPSYGEDGLPEYLML